MRDPKLNVLADGRLMLNTAAAPLAATNQRQSLAWFTENGSDWSGGPHEIGESDWWMWGVCSRPDGTVYSVGYGDTKTSPLTTRLYRSTDGINYETIVPTLTADNNTSEAGLTFLQDGSAVTLVRQDYLGIERSLVGVADGDYTEWTFQVLDKRIGGPEIIELPDGNIIAASRLYSGDIHTGLSWLDPEGGQITELLRLPSGGDTSYPRHGLARRFALDQLLLQPRRQSEHLSRSGSDRAGAEYSSALHSRAPRSSLPPSKVRDGIRSQTIHLRSGRSWPVSHVLLLDQALT